MRSREPPLFGSETGESIELILATAKAKNFSNPGLDTDLPDGLLAREGPLAGKGLGSRQ
jgi:hypothetical protein